MFVGICPFEKSCLCVQFEHICSVVGFDNMMLFCRPSGHFHVSAGSTSVLSFIIITISTLRFILCKRQNEMQ